MLKLSKISMLMILSILFSMLSLVFLFIAIINIQVNYENLDFLSLDFIIAGISCMFISIFLSYKYKQILRLKLLKLPQVITSVKCTNETCNYKEERLFQEGDYIFKNIGKCPKCNNDLYIDAIYAFESINKK